MTFIEVVLCAWPYIQIINVKIYTQIHHLIHINTLKCFYHIERNHESQRQKIDYIVRKLYFES